MRHFGWSGNLVDITKRRQIRLNAFEMWVWRRILKINWRMTWMERVTNVEVLQSVNEERSFMNCIERRQKNWIEHTLRRDGLLKEV